MMSLWEGQHTHLAQLLRNAAGQWLSNPQAVMYAVAQNSEITTVLLTLSNPTIPQQPAGTTTTNNNNSERCITSAFAPVLHLNLSCIL